MSLFAFSLHYKYCIWIGIILSGFTVLGCVSAQTEYQELKKDECWDEKKCESIQSEFNTFKEEFETLIVSTSEKIERETTDRKVKNACLIWKTRMMDRVQDKLKEKESFAAFLDTWVLCLQMFLYLEKGDGMKLFKANQPFAVDAAKHAVDMIEKIGVKHLTSEKFQKVRKKVEEYARVHSFTGIFDENNPGALHLESSVLNDIKSIIEFPLSPFKTVKEGVESIQQFDTIADRFVDVLEDIPHEMRWELESLLIKIDENLSIQSALTSIDRISKSAEKLAKTAEELPRQVRSETELLLNSIDNNKSTQSLITILEHISRTSEKLVKIADTLPHQIRSQAESILDAIDKHKSTQTSLAILEHISKNMDKLAKTAEELPSEIRQEIEIMLKAIDKLQSVQSALTSIESLSKNSKDFPKVMQESMDRSVQTTITQSQILIDHITWRIAQLMSLAFVLSVILIILARFCRVKPKSAA